MAHGQPIRSSGSEIPDKLYFRIGEVARICAVPAYVLRFWESEFAPLRPNKGGTGQRLYRKRDVETALRIKRLLYDEGYTIPGARQILKGELKVKEPQLSLAIPGTSTVAMPVPLHQQIRALRAELAEVLRLVSGDAPEMPGGCAPRSTKAARIRRQAVLQMGCPPTGASTGLFELDVPNTSHRSAATADPQRDPAAEAVCKDT